MNKFWVRLSIAIFAVTTLAMVVTFSIFFVLSWVGEPSFTAVSYAHEYEHVAAPFVEAYLIEGKSDDEIMALLDTELTLQEVLQEKRAAGFALGIDVEDRSWQRILSDYLYELFGIELFQTLLVGAFFSVIASILISRQLVRPLAQLTRASHALGQKDLSQRVMVQGSDEINALTATFNHMAAQLEHNEWLRRSMLADVSHELRTPLAGLEGTLRATLDDVFELDKQHIGHLYQQTRHLSRLIDDLHLLSRAEADRLPLNKMSVNLSQLLHDIADLFLVLATEATVVLQLDIVPDLFIEVDAGRLRQAVSNLLTNALRHTATGGQIMLLLERVPNSVVITVADNGVGIAAEDLPYLFERFYRADKSRSRDSGGTGLGLAITKALIEAHGGMIEAKSAGLGQGSRFCITLPVVKASRPG